MKCDVCGNEAFSHGFSKQTFTVNDKLTVVERIPALICQRCQEPNFAPDIAEQVRKMVWEPHVPKQMIQAEVLEFRAA